MQKAVAGDKDAFGLLYQEYFDPVYRYVYFRVQNKAVAEDVVQTVFLKVFAKLGKYQDRQRPPLAFFFTIARNAIIDHWRKDKNVESMEDNNNSIEIADNNANTAEMVSRSIAIEEIGRGLEKISQDQREAIILKFLNELSYEEIAKILNKKEAAVRKLVSRGLNNLRQYFDQRNIRAL